METLERTEIMNDVTALVAAVDRNENAHMRPPCCHRRRKTLPFLPFSHRATESGIVLRENFASLSANSQRSVCIQIPD